MAAKVRPSMIPRCSACTQRWTESSLSGRSSLSYTVVRNAHKTANASPIPNTIPVMLLKAVNDFGKQGAIVPVPVSYMRNKLYPQGQARYIVGDEAKQLKDRPQVIARDPGFDARPHLQRAASAEAKRIRRAEFFAPENAENIKKMFHEKWREQKERKKARKAKAAATAALQAMSPDGAIVNALSPERSMGLLETFLPSSLTYERPMNAQTETNGGAIPIYGSVSTDDVIETIRSLTSHNDEAARINFSSLTVEFANLPEGEDNKRIKHIGTFRVEFGVKGADQRVTRQVIVNQEAPRTAEMLKQVQEQKTQR